MLESNDLALENIPFIYSTMDSRLELSLAANVNIPHSFLRKFAVKTHSSFFFIIQKRRTQTHVT